ncbi:MAG: DUF1634 domain-containing protein [Armatimonadetes bacterium]|nr:DUF1634 domain-containing protein [Armatimonadota bacterium]
MRRAHADVNRYVQKAMSVGVVTSFLILVWGSILFLINPKAGEEPGPILQILRGALHLDPIAIINLGLLALLVSPAAGVIAAMVALILQGDKKYALVSLAVLCVLALAALLGR